MRNFYLFSKNYLFIKFTLIPEITKHSFQNRKGLRIIIHQLWG